MCPQMQPNSIQNGAIGDNNQTLMVLQGWQKNGECPEGTIPIVRTPKSVYHRKDSLSSMSTKHNHIFSNSDPYGHEVTFYNSVFFIVSVTLIFFGYLYYLLEIN